MKELLLKEKEETIRLQANLIETQSQLLRHGNYRRKKPNALINIPKPFTPMPGKRYRITRVDPHPTTPYSTLPYYSTHAESSKPFNLSTSKEKVSEQISVIKRSNTTACRSGNNNTRNDLVSGDIKHKQSMTEVLVDLEKQTNYEIERLNNVHLGKRKSIKY